MTVDPTAPRELTYDERATWGECPVCRAPHGAHCDPLMGIPLGISSQGSLTENGVHLGRIMNAPRRVKLVPA